MYECADSGDYHHHHAGECVDAQSEFDVKWPPSIHPHKCTASAVAGRHREERQKCPRRDAERREHHARPHDVDRAPPMPWPEEQVEYDAECRKQQD